jgi:hypothetical protein
VNEAVFAGDDRVVDLAGGGEQSAGVEGVGHRCLSYAAR